ncbi:MAG: hypothetical protein VYD07_09360, partial [Pseudomonadota bacterium]|nr:hypothetical protein [Pseudomonadota bacterium]
AHGAASIVAQNARRTGRRYCTPAHGAASIVAPKARRTSVVASTLASIVAPKARPTCKCE